MKKFLFLLPLMILLIVSNTVDAKKKKYPNGDYYEGEWKKGKPNGNGKMIFANGDIYEGEWTKGEMNGNGKMIFTNGDIYEGEWTRGERNGIGKMIYKFIIYEGEWVGGMINGKGKFTDVLNNTFEGYCDNGLLRTGKLIYNNGGYCEGDFQSNSNNIDNITSLYLLCKLENGTCNNFGRNKERFTGKILNGKYDEGKLILANGGWLEGKWMNGEFYNGVCENYIQNKERFTGKILNGKYDEGKLTQPYGGWFEGKWVDGVFSYGTCDGYMDGSYYQGEWKNKNFTGNFNLRGDNFEILSFTGTILNNKIKEGKVEYKDNSVYEGEFKESSNYQSGLLKEYIPSGKGCLYISDNQDSYKSTIDGIWKDGRLIQTVNGNIKINDIDYKVSVNKDSITIPYNSKTYTIILPNNYSVICQSLMNEVKKTQNTITIELKQPGTILSYLPLEKLSSVENLIIIGFLTEKDIKVIRDCKRLKYLDLSRAYITYSPEYLEKQRADTEALGLIFDLMGIALDNNYKDGKVTTNDYQTSKALTYLLQSATEFSEPEKKCIVPQNAFEGMPLLETVKLPLRAADIDKSAFKNCINLKIVNLPPYLKSVDDEVFMGCKKLQNILLPKTIERIGKESFRECEMLESITLPEDLSELGDQTFNGCKNLKKIVFPEGLIEIPYYCLHNCIQLKEIIIPNTITSINSRGNNSRTSTADLYFKSSTPAGVPTDFFNTGDRIHFPKGNITAYYDLLGNTVKYIEE